MLLNTYNNIESVKKYSLVQWSQLVHECYGHYFVARLYALLKSKNLANFIPSSLRWHFSSAELYFQAHKKDIFIEMEKIEKALKMANVKPCYLKGTAYLNNDLMVSKGRVFSDIDLYVEKQHIDKVEQILHWHGWKPGKLSDYDQRYYRQWMHEIPPLTHQTRGSTIDLHHNLLPLTARYSFDESDIKNAVNEENKSLSPVELTLHCIVHLMMESEFIKGFRDLTDIHLLILEYSDIEEDFLLRLIARSKQVGVEVLVLFTLELLSQHFNLVLTSDVKHQLNGIKINPMKKKFMIAVFSKALLTPIRLDNSLSNLSCHFILYIRGHYLRMPMRLLLPHLLKKALSRSHDDEERQPQN
ncbi:nucleotidyltransferase family protein [Thalassotalea ganghwensis]